MKKGYKRMMAMVGLMAAMTGCGGGMKSSLEGPWYVKGGDEPAFVLYDDGTCEIAGEYGTGSWSVVNDNQLKLTNFYGETETAPIFSLKDGCLTLGDEESQSQFYNSP